MHDAAIFQGLISPRPLDLVQAQHRNARARFLFLLYSLLTSLATGAFAWYLLWQFTQTDQWEGLWSYSSWEAVFLLGFPVLLLLVLPAIAVVRQNHARETGARALPLREAARQGNDATAPLDSLQPAAAESAGWAITIPWHGRVSRADTSARSARLSVGRVLGILAGYAPVVQGLDVLPSDFGRVTAVINLALLTFSLLVMGMLVWGLLTRGTMRVSATQD